MQQLQYCIHVTLMFHSLVVLIRLPISNSSSPLSKPLGIVLSTTITILYPRHPHVPQLTKFFGKIYELISLFDFFDFSLYGPQRQQNLQYGRFSFFFLICFNLKFQENCIRLTLLDRFWLVHIPFGWMIKFQSLAQFPVDHLSHLILCCLILLLCV